MTKHWRLLLILAMTGCAAQLDMQGYDPNEFYTKHPVKNQVEPRHATYKASLASAKGRLTTETTAALRNGLRAAEPMATQSIEVKLSPAQAKSDARKDVIKRALRSLGYVHNTVTFAPSKELRGDEAQFDATYASVVPPHCPDWRMSPVTTYSNTKQANIGCSSEVNLGAQVADPNDLVKGSGGEATSDSERNAAIIRQYHSGQASSGSSSGGSSGGESGSSSGGTSAPAQ